MQSGNYDAKHFKPEQKVSNVVIECNRFCLLRLKPSDRNNKT